MISPVPYLVHFIQIIALRKCELRVVQSSRKPYLYQAVSVSPLNSDWGDVE